MILHTDMSPEMQQLAFEEAEVILRNLIKANRPLFKSRPHEEAAAVEYSALAGAIVRLLFVEAMTETRDGKLSLADYQPELDAIWEVIRKSRQKRIRHRKEGGAEPMRLRRWKSRRPQAPKPPSNRRLSAARRHLQAERDRYGLFAEDVAKEQPTPEERIDNFDQGFNASQWEDRKRTAALWRRVRALLAATTGRDREVLLDSWNRAGYPGEPTYLLEHLKNFLPRIQERIAAGERWFVFRVENSLRIVLWMPEGAFKAASKTMAAGPFEDYLDAVKAVHQLEQEN